MANDGTIASKLQLDGEQQYKKALSDAYRTLRVLRSELKAETAEMGRNASSQDKARAKMASLQKQIAEQQKVVKTLEKALADSRKEYADNQEVQDKWAEKLNKAREALANMQNALGQTEDDLAKFGDSMKDVADSSGEAMTTVVSFNDAIKSIGTIASGIGDSLSGIFTATVDTMQEMVDEMFSLMSQAWAAAGNWKEIQTIWGGDLESIERVYTAMGLQGVDASEVTSGIQKFITNVHNGNKDTMAALDQLHITEDQFSSHWDFFVAVMDKASMFKGNDRYNLMTSLFGDKKGAGMTNMLDNWRDAMNRYEQDVEDTGLALSTPEIEALDTVSHKITEIQELWNTIKTNIGAKLSDILNMDALSEDTLTILRDIGAILNSEGDKRAELTLKLSDDVEKLIEDISAAMENLGGFLQELGGDLQKSDNPLVRFIGQLIEGLGGILDWLGEHGTEITSFLEKVIPWILTNKLVEATTGKGIGDWATDILKLGLDVAVLGKIFGGAAGTALGASGAAATLGAGIGAALLKAVPVLAGLATLLTPSATSDQLGDNSLIDENGKLTKEAIAAGYTLDENGNAVKPSWQYEYDVNGNQPAEIVEDVDLPEAVYTLADKVDAIQDWWDAYRNAETGADTWDEEGSAFDWMTTVLGDEFGTFWDRFLEESEGKSLTNMQDIPASWYSEISGALKNLTNNNYTGTNDEDLPSKLEAAVERGAAKKPVQVVVQLEGETLVNYIDHGFAGKLSSYA